MILFVNLQDNQFPVPLIAQLVEHCISITEARVSIPVLQISNNQIW